LNILIVDDEPLVRKSLGRACRVKGHEVSEAADGSEGLAKWLSMAPDLVFVDVLMPGLSGPELLAEIVKVRGTLRPTRVILISAYSGEHNFEESGQSGALHDLFIPKPFDDVFAVVAQAELLFADK
jgi:CheY-like chemotaxis protein